MNERMCIVTRERGEPEDLVRFVRAPDGAVVPDIRCELPGRGVWVTARRAMVESCSPRSPSGQSMRETIRPKLCAVFPGSACRVAVRLVATTRGEDAKRSDG